MKAISFVKVIDIQCSFIGLTTFFLLVFISLSYTHGENVMVSIMYISHGWETKAKF